MQRERILVRCLRWFAEPGSTFPEDLAAAWLRRHPQAVSALGLRITDDKGHVIYDDHEVHAARREDVVRALAPVLEQQQSTPWSMLVGDVKGEILDKLMALGEEDQTMTRLFSVLAFQFVNRDARKVAHGALMRAGESTGRPPLIAVGRLIDENASPALFAWSLWLYTASTAPATHLSPAEIGQLVYHVVKADRPVYLQALLLGLPLRVGAVGTMTVYAHVLHVLLPLALYRARSLGWHACQTLAWARSVGWTLDHFDFFAVVGDTTVYPITVHHGREPILIDAKTWRIRAATMIAHWYAFPLDEDDALGFPATTGDPTEKGIPLDGLQWLLARRIITKTVVQDGFANAFLDTVVLDTTDKARFVVRVLPPEAFSFLDLYVGDIFARIGGVSARTRVEILSVLLTRCPMDQPARLLIFVEYVTRALRYGTMDGDMAQALWDAFHALYDEPGHYAEFDVVTRWAEELHAYSPASIPALGVLLRHAMSVDRDGSAVLEDFFDRVSHEEVAEATDAALRDFVVSMDAKGIHWDAIRKSIRGAGFVDRNGVRHASLPLTLRAVEEKRQAP